MLKLKCKNCMLWDQRISWCGIGSRVNTGIVCNWKDANEIKWFYSFKCSPINCHYCEDRSHAKCCRRKIRAEDAFAYEPELRGASRNISRVVPSVYWFGKVTLWGAKKPENSAIKKAKIVIKSASKGGAMAPAAPPLGAPLTGTNLRRKKIVFATPLRRSDRPAAAAEPLNLGHSWRSNLIYNPWTSSSLSDVPLSRGMYV